MDKIDVPAPISLDKVRRKKRGEPPTPYPYQGPKVKTQGDINIELIESISELATYCEQLSDYVEALEERMENNENHMRLLLKGLREYMGTKEERDKGLK
jgi:hypothetical protein